jgi:hypothetical protein
MLALPEERCSAPVEPGVSPTTTAIWQWAAEPRAWRSHTVAALNPPPPPHPSCGRMRTRPA